MWSLGDKKASLAECRHMINCVGKDGDHMVNFNEFQCRMHLFADKNKLLGVGKIMDD